MSIAIIRRFAHDYVQRLRVSMSTAAPHLLDRLGRETVEHITAQTCDELGVDYAAPPDLPRRNDGRPAPWARKVKRA